MLKAMTAHLHWRQIRLVIALTCGLLYSVIIISPRAYAAQFPPQSGSGSVGLQGTISAPAPTQAPTIATPGNGATFSAVPITVSGLCPSGLLIKVFSNNVFVGSTECGSGSYSLQADLFAGQNQLVARDYDALDQSGPDSNTVTVTFNDIQQDEYGSHVFLTSAYAKRGANPGTTLTWPVIISNGTGPYAMSVNWGDNTGTQLLSEPFAGTVNLSHVYNNAGVYQVIVQVTDSKGTEAFLQVVAVANGAIQSSSGGTTKNNNAIVTSTKVLWWPALAMLPLVLAAFWIGRRHELFSLRRQLEKSRDD